MGYVCPVCSFDNDVLPADAGSLKSCQRCRLKYLAPTLSPEPSGGDPFGGVVPGFQESGHFQNPDGTSANDSPSKNQGESEERPTLFGEPLSNQPRRGLFESEELPDIPFAPPAPTAGPTAAPTAAPASAPVPADLSNYRPNQNPFTAPVPEGQPANFLESREPRAATTRVGPAAAQGSPARPKSNPFDARHFGDRAAQAPALAPAAARARAPAPQPARARPAASPAGGYLLSVVEGCPLKSFAFHAGGSYVVGRDPSASITVNSKSVSRRHAQIETSGPIPVIIDLNAANGVIVNGTKVSRLVLNNGDLIKLGEVILRFQVQS